MDQTIRVFPPALTVFVGRCAEHSANVSGAASSAPPVPGTEQATAAVVGAIHTSLAATGVVFGARLATTADTTASAAATYAATEAANAAAVSL